LRKREKQAGDRGETEMSEVASQPLPNALIKVVDLLVESRIRIDAMEQILVKTNSVAYELYLGMIENLRAQTAAEINQVLTQTLESQPAES
jgi:hypothetical protein